MKYKFLIQNLINSNKELVQKTAIRNCHCVGLNSFIINEKPKIRLFIADNNCELYEKFDYKNPLIPIHPHKYNDTFLYNNGELIHHIYFKDDVYFNVVFNSYKYLRLNDKFDLKKIDSEYLFYFGDGDYDELHASTLHTVSLKKTNNKNVSWLIVEGEEDKDFKQIAYHKDLKINSHLYKQFNNAYNYINHYINE